MCHCGGTKNKPRLNPTPFEDPRTRSIFDPPARGSEDPRNRGPEDPSDPRTPGQSDPRRRGPRLDPRNPGQLDPRVPGQPGQPDPRTTGRDPRTVGATPPVDKRVSGPELVQALLAQGQLAERSLQDYLAGRHQTELASALRVQSARAA